MIQRQCPECDGELVLARRPDNQHGPGIEARPPLIGDAVFAEAGLPQNRSAKTNVPSSLTMLAHKSRVESERVLLLTLSGPLN
jgi:hypothetical protein